MTRIVLATFGSGKINNSSNITAWHQWCHQIKVDAILATRAHPAEIERCIAYGQKRPKTVDFWLDSGAFSAWTKGDVYEVEEYRQYILSLMPRLRCFRRVFAISLDQIPGRFGKKVTLSQIEEATYKSIENANYLLSHGVNVVPVHHQGEPLWVLKTYLSMAEYVGISPASDQPTKSRLEYLESILPLFEENPKTPTHNFGNTATEQLITFPFYSADSQSWKASERFGKTFNIKSPKDVQQNRSLKTSKAGDAYVSYHCRSQESSMKIIQDNVFKVLKSQAQINQFWADQGITWKEPQGLFK